MNTRCIRSSLLLLVALTSGCGNSDSETGASPIDPGGPLLDRPAGAKYDCSVSRPMARLDSPWGRFSLVPGATEAEAAVAVAERSGPTPTSIYNRVTWSTLGLDGQLGSPSVVNAPTGPTFPLSVSAASDGEKSTLVWTETQDSGYSLNSAQVNASGTVVTPASVLAKLEQSVEAKIAKTDSGYALLTVDNGPSGGKLSFRLLDEGGQFASPPVVIAQGSYITTGSIASVGNHFVVSYTDNQYYESKLVSRLLFLDLDGSVLGEPFAFENSAVMGFSPTIPSLLARGDEVLAAWSISTGDSSYEKQDAATTVRLARFDADGKLQGNMYDLQAPVNDREAVQPLLVEMGDEVGLLWADGSVIYICGGCVPDHSQKFVVLDGESFLPQSNVVELTNTFPSGGLLSAEIARKGDELLVVSTLTYHTWGEGASGTLRCVK